MGLFDTVELPKNFPLPDFPGNPRYYTDEGGQEIKRRWQTKSLLNGLDEYRLRKISDKPQKYQIERRVPPRTKMTKNGNMGKPEVADEILWWNVLRWTGSLLVGDSYRPNNTYYRYKIDISNGVFTLEDVSLVEKRKGYIPGNYCYIDTQNHTIESTGTHVREIVNPIVEEGRPWKELFREHPDITLQELLQSLRYAYRPKPNGYMLIQQSEKQKQIEEIIDEVLAELNNNSPVT